ncbi:hypothetical protein C8Q80DRAFT_1334860 [Daedaleopsis nitida]|nr:hypothetical protein C8Q80DRAFT_1334860 [Daedaleopsis nitida]
MSKPGLLFVFSEPGAVPDAEFNDWYDNEHVPLRLPIPAIQSWSRWVATDNQKPSYLALYDLTDSDALNHPPYSTLASTRSARETELIKKVGMLDRRAYDKIDVPVPPRAGDAYDVRKPGPQQVPSEYEEDYNGWYDKEHTEMLSKIPQWVRTTRYVYREGGATGADESLKPNGPGGKAPKYLALHEFSDGDSPSTPEFQHAASTEWSAKVKGYATIFDIRMFKLMRTWERA